MKKLLFLSGTLIFGLMYASAGAQVQPATGPAVQPGSTASQQNVAQPAPQTAKKKKRKKQPAISTDVQVSPGSGPATQTVSPGTQAAPVSSGTADPAPGKGANVSGSGSNGASGSPATSGSGSATYSPSDYSGQGTASVNDIINKSQPIVQNSANGQINWTSQYVEATGESAIDNDRFKNPAQARAMAQRGAVVIAQRNLLELIQGVNVVGETTVKDMITSSDYVYSRVEGVVRGAEMVGQAIEENGMMKVRLRMPLYATNGLAPAIYNSIPGNGSGGTGTAAAGTSSGQAGQGGAPLNTSNASGMVSDAQKLVFNLGGKKFDPSMFPLIMDANGNVVLDLKKIYDPNTGQFPQIVQASKQLLQDMNLQKGVQVLDAVQSRMSAGKIVLTDASIKKVNWSKVGETAAKIGKFLLMFI